MASTPNPPADDKVNTAFLREVDEELRRSEAAAFWQRWGRWLIGAVILGLALFGGWLFWQNQQREAAGAEAEIMAGVLAELEANRIGGAATKLAPLKQSEVEGNRAVALILDADLKLQNGDVKGAVAAYRAIAADMSLAQPFRDLATVRAAGAEFDTADPMSIITALKPLAVAGSPWFGSAGEMTAMAYLKLDRPRDAAPIFAALAQDEGVPETIRSRSVQLAGILGIDAVKPQDKEQEK